MGDINGALATARKINYAETCAAALRDIASVQTQTRDIKGAFATAQKINDAACQAESLRDIASAQMKMGDKQSARDTFASALLSARNIDRAFSRARVMRDIASAQAKAGYAQLAQDTFTAALSVAHSIIYYQDQLAPMAICNIALAQAEAGYMQSARDTFIAALSAAQNGNGACNRMSDFCGIALAQMKIGNKQSARDTFAAALSTARAAARTIDAIFYAGALSNIASSRAKAGDIKGAFATARKIKKAENYCTDDYANALRDIALAQVKTGDKQSARNIFAAALSAAESISCPFSRIRAIRNIAAAQAEAGDKQSARDTFAIALSATSSIDEAGPRGVAVCDIASAQAKAGDINNAFATVRKINDKDDSTVLRDIASAQAKMGDFRDAMKTAIEIKWEETYGEALVAIAKYLVAHPNHKPKQKNPPSKRTCVVSDESADPEIIRQVEKAAVAHVRKILRTEGWRIVSVETMKRGYDLHCVQPDKEMHVEVKGTRGDEPSFMLTRGEHERAESDPKFALYLVLRALDAPRLVVFSGEDLLRKFDFQTVQYKATEK